LIACLPCRINSALRSLITSLPFEWHLGDVDRAGAVKGRQKTNYFQSGNLIPYGRIFLTGREESAQLTANPNW
jgi:hypothetical protein